MTYDNYLHARPSAARLPAMQNLVTRAKFAELAGVNPSTLTRVCRTVLKDAVEGKMIDAAHDDAVAYLEKQAIRATAPTRGEVDSLYDEALAVCAEAKRYGVKFIEKELKIGRTRAQRIVDVMKANKVVDARGRPIIQDVAPPSKPTTKPKLRGNAVTRERKKQSATAASEPIEIPENIRDFMGMTLQEVIRKFGTDYRFLDWLKSAAQIESIEEKRLKNAKTRGELVSRELVQAGVIDQFNAAHLRLLKDGVKTISAGVKGKVDAGADLPEIENYVGDIVGSFIRPVKSKVARSLNDI